MALTISTGFVVDDAIVMIENISRYIEEGERLSGGIEGRQADWLHHRVADGVTGGGFDSPAFHGRDHWSTVSRIRGHAQHRIGVSAILSLTLTAMMCAFLLRAHEQPGWLARQFERALPP